MYPHKKKPFTPPKKMNVVLRLALLLALSVVSVSCVESLSPQVNFFEIPIVQIMPLTCELRSPLQGACVFAWPQSC